MVDIIKNNNEFIPYKEIIKKRALDYYHANKDAINQKRNGKYANPPLEDKKKKEQEKDKQWYNNLTLEKQQELRIKARKYHKNRYDNMMGRVK